MFILEVIPLAKIPLSLPQILSYFSKEKVKERGLVLVPLRKKKVPALVLSSEALEKKKIEIKKADFKLKKVEKIISKEEVLNQSQLELLFWLSKKYLSPLGVSLKLFLPKIFLKRKREIKLKKAKNLSKKTKKFPLPLLVWQKERKNFYLKEIKKTLKEKRKILFVLPDFYQAFQNYQFFKKELKKRKIFLFSANLKSSQEFQIWQKIREGKIDLILGTKSALFLPFQNLGKIIIEKENDSTFESWGKEPRYNTKLTALKLGEIQKAKVIFGDSLPSLESFYFAKKNKFELKKEKAKNQKKVIILDLKGQKNEILPDLIKKKLEEILKKEKRAIFFINRKGIAPALLCQDCGYILECKNCSVSLVYHLFDKEPKLFCHHCGYKISPPSRCLSCQGYHLKLLGKGLQRVSIWLKKFFPQAKILDFNLDLAPNLEKQKSILFEFLKTKGSILVSTKLVFKFAQNFHQKIPLGIGFFDPLLNFPEFRTRERVFQFLEKFSEICDQIILETYNPHLSIFKYFKENKIEEFFEKELNQRKMFFYPPFSEILLLIFSHKDPKKCQKEAKELKEKIQKKTIFFKNELEILGPAPAFLPKLKKKYYWQIILKIKGKKREIKKILLKIIPPKWKIKVNPQSLL